MNKQELKELKRKIKDVFDWTAPEDRLAKIFDILYMYEDEMDYFTAYYQSQERIQELENGEAKEDQ